MKVKIVNTSNNPLPKYAHEPINGLVQDSGMDIYADMDNINPKFVFDCTVVKDDTGHVTKVILPPLGRILIPTGIHAAAPNGYEFQVRDRSGHALKKGLILVNGIGTIDSIFTGDIGVILCNVSNHEVEIEAGERIAQLVLCKVETCEWVEVDSLDTTDRGDGGYNSTGVK